MHKAAVTLIQNNPALIATAQATLARWMETGDQRTLPLWTQWRDILEQRNWTAALEDSEAGRERRQASPLSTLLPAQTRLNIIRGKKRNRPDFLKGS